MALTSIPPIVERPIPGRLATIDDDRLTVGSSSRAARLRRLLDLTQRGAGLTERGGLVAIRSTAVIADHCEHRGHPLQW